MTTQASPGLQAAIARNRRRTATRARLHRMRLKHFDHLDAGKGDQAARIVNRLHAVLAELCR